MLRPGAGAANAPVAPTGAGSVQAVLLPPRPQPPLWRSPDSTPIKAPNPTRPGPDSADEGEQPDADSDPNAIGAHIHQISRHRDQGERPRTPPGYWNIGFPDTQQAAAINEAARSMHREKMAMVESEARYVRVLVLVLCE